VIDQLIDRTGLDGALPDAVNHALPQFGGRRQALCLQERALLVSKTDQAGKRTADINGREDPPRRRWSCSMNWA
jgi:hypothetical protein